MQGSAPRFRLRQLFGTVAAAAIFLALFAYSKQEHFGPLQHKIVRAAFSPDGNYLAVFAYEFRDARVPLKFYVADVSRTIVLLDTATLTKFTPIQHDFRKGNLGPGLPERYPGWSFAFSPDSSCLYTCADVGTGMRAWDIKRGDWSKNPIANRSIEDAFRLSPDGAWIVVQKNNALDILSTQTGKPLARSSDWDGPFEFSKDGKRLVVVTGYEIRVWDLAKRRIIRRIPDIYDSLDNVNGTALSPDGTTLAVLRLSGVRVIDLEVGAINRLLPSQVTFHHFKGGWGTTGGSNTWGLAMSPDGKVLACWGYYGMKFFDVLHDCALLRISVDTSTQCFAFSPDSKSYVTSDQRGVLTIWDTATGNRIRSANLF